MHTFQLTVNDEIRLTEPRPIDTPAWIAHFREKAIIDNTLTIPFPYTEQHAEEFLARAAERTEQTGRVLSWAIRNRDQFLIGGTGFNSFVPGKSHHAEIGYWLAKPYWGRGIATAVVKAACRYAFAELGLEKVTAHVFAFNAASARVLQKCGFREEGYLRRHHCKDGRFIDARLFGLLKEDLPFE